MKLRKKFTAVMLAGAMLMANAAMALADGSMVVTLGVDLNSNQKQMMLNYFGVNKDEVMIIDVSNAEERKYLRGVASDAQLGRHTISCAYVEPTDSNGINVKTANLTWVTSSMIASTLTTAGLQNANVVAAAPYAVSGTGALTGVIKAFEDASGETLDEDKKELANEELITTGDLGEEIGQDEATGVVNDVKEQVIKDNVTDTMQIADIINNVTNNYNVTLTQKQIDQLISLMQKIAEQGYNYNDIKVTLENVQFNVNENLSSLGHNVNTVGLFEKIKHWFSNIGGNDVGILEQTDESALGSDAVISATEKDLQDSANKVLEQARNSIEEFANSKEGQEALDQAEDIANDVADQAKGAYNEAKESGLIDRIIAWFENLF